MNTENRSSNPEMVSVPREWAKHYADLLEERCGYEKAEQVTAFLAQPAQHQGEPVALPARKHPVRADYSQDILAEGWNACLNEIAKMGPLYTRADPGEVVRFGIQVEKLLCGALGREWSATGISIETLVAELKAKADPGEVERLRTELVEWKERCQRNSDEAMSWMAKHDALRAQLAERTKQLDNALDDIEGLIGAVRHYDKNHQLHNEEGTLRRYRASLSASAEPTAREAQALEAEKILGIERLPAEPSTPKSKPRAHDVTMFQRAPTPPTINGHKLNCKAVDDYKPGECSCGHIEPSAPTETLYERGRRIFAEGRGMSCIWGDCKSDDELPEVERGWKAAFDEAVAAGTVPEVKL